MFGYVRPALNRLSNEEKERYKSAYCGLCHAMGKRHGWLARFTLNYDFAFLAILLYGGEGTADCRAHRCPAHLFRKPRVCICGSALDTAADESVILTWHKLSDDVSDRSFFGGLPARFLRFAFRKAYRRAAAEQPEFDRRVRDNLARLHGLEEARSPELDRVADTFASLLAAAADCCTREDHRRVMKQLLYHLGRWIYLADAWDDLKEDRKKKRYNALDTRFSGRAEEERAYVETTMTHSVRLIRSAAVLVEFGPWSEIVYNVIDCGIPAVQSAVLEGRWKELRSAREKRK